MGLAVLHGPYSSQSRLHALTLPNGSSSLFHKKRGHNAGCTHPSLCYFHLYSALPSNRGLEERKETQERAGLVSDNSATQPAHLTPLCFPDKPRAAKEQHFLPLSIAGFASQCDSSPAVLFPGLEPEGLFGDSR